MDFYIFNNCINRGSMSGTDKRTLEWSKIFQKKGHNIRLFVPTNARNRYQKCNFNLVFTSSLDMVGNGLLIFFTYLWRGIRGCLAQKRIPSGSIIYSSSDALADLLPAVYMKLHNRKTVWITGLHLIAPNPFKGFKKATTEGFTFPTLRGLYYYFYQKLAIYAMKHLAQLVMVSNNMDKELLVKRGVLSQKIMVVYGGVNFEEVRKAREERKYDACFIGRVHSQKGIPDLLEAWSLVCRKKKDAKLALVGQLDAVKEEVDKRGLNKNIEFLGYLDGIEKFQALKSSKVLLMPSSYEGCALVACEAMACGLPVVAYDLPMLREVYPKGMVRVPIGDIEQLSQEIISLLDDEQRRKRIYEEARELASEFSWEKTANRILARLTGKDKRGEI